MKILLLGKTGLLGTAIIEASKNWQHELIAWGKEDLDITKQHEVIKKISHEKPDVVINAAAYTDVDGCERNPTPAMEINGYAPGFIAQACQASLARLIHISTDYVFNGQEKGGYRENHPEEPINIYGASKLLGEESVKKNTDRYFIVRVSWLFGVDPGKLPERKDFLINFIHSTKEKNKISILNDQHGKITYAPDLAAALPQFFTGEKYGIYHLPNEGILTRYDLAKETVEILGLNVTVTPATAAELGLKWPAKRPKHSSLVNTRLEKLRPWKDALKDYLQKTRFE